MEVQVIEKIQGRIDRTTGLQINRKLKVAAYARVSTDSEDQLNSFESQVKYYNEKYQKYRMVFCRSICRWVNIRNTRLQTK